MPIHPICHRTLHQALTNKELAALGDDADSVRAVPAIAQFLAWIANKDPDFHAPTRGGR